MEEFFSKNHMLRRKFQGEINPKFLNLDGRAPLQYTLKIIKAVMSSTNFLYWFGDSNGEQDYSLSFLYLGVSGL